ncbi:MAG: hypothetical protein LUG16_00520 [Candidatus Gastranaerophilales bacterium]|nr:hypothetical protein [Candidatus Gastranaerophilales bacterium]
MVKRTSANVKASLFFLVCITKLENTPPRVVFDIIHNDFLLFVDFIKSIQIVQQKNSLKLSKNLLGNFIYD